MAQQHDSPFRVAEGMGLSEIVSDLRFEAVSDNNPNVKAAIVVPTRLSQLTYGPLVAEVKCFSRLKPGFHYRGLFPLGQMTEGQAITKAGVLAGALAENLCDVYKDKLNTTEWARDGVSAARGSVAVHGDRSRAEPAQVGGFLGHCRGRL